ncbi:helix-turn-helix transcriptional regulator [Actinocorallia sp. B10E7]|uniref:helix-turn-helix domain-containing protein n=1 Tax=Actinocorallia sp. B10E7 TaxID=3153558 RepID=UPI00325F15AF
MPVHVRDQVDPKLSHWHFLAYAIRLLRERHGLSLTQVGKLLDVTRGTVSNFEAGRRKLGDDYARVLDERYGTGELIQTIVFYARMGHNPDWAKTLAEYEAVAQVLKIYHGQVIPGPFQTEDTIRAQLSASRTITDIEAAVKARLLRQEAILNRERPPYIWALLEESVLEQQAGGPEVLREQLIHLRELSECPHIGVRVIPKTAGSHLGTDGPMRFLGLADRDVAYVGAWRGGRMIESPAEVREVAVDWDFISQKALSDEDTRVLIDRKMEALA